MTFFAGCKPSTKTWHWEEEVLLSSGEQMRVERTITLGRASIAGNPFEFTYHKLRESTVRLAQSPDVDPWRGQYRPLVLDRINNRWRVVVPLLGYHACESYDFPPESVAVFTLEPSGWTRSRYDDAAARLTVNLMGPDFRQSDPEQLQPMTVQDKAAAKGRLTGYAVPGIDVAAAVSQLKRMGDSCFKIRPPYNAARETSLGEFAKLAFAPRTAVIDAVDSAPKVIDREQYLRIAGTWSGNAYIRNCDSEVGTEPLYDWSGSHGRVTKRLVAVAMTISSGELGQAVAYLPSTSNLVTVTCSGEKVYALLRSSAQELRIVEYNRNAKAVQAWSFALPNLTQWLEKSRGMVGGLVDEGELFSLSLLNYRYEGLESNGGTIVHDVKLILPKESIAAASTV